MVLEGCVELGDKRTEDACVFELLGILRARFGISVDDSPEKEADEMVLRVRRGTPGRIRL